MTYGENSGEMRESMVWLLGRHRILQRLGGGGNYAVKPWSTEADRERMGQIITRYRGVALTWCLQAVTAATPKTDLTGTTEHARNPAEDLRYRLGRAVTAAGPSEPLSHLLATRHHNPLMDTWQRLARAAALGEHDFSAGVNFGKLTPEQSRTVLKDAADLTRALVLLDRRYWNVPGWQHLREHTRLGRAAEATSLMVDQDRRDFGVDERGWRPIAGRIEGPALPGVAGAVQAEHNMLIDLARFPDALNLRRVLHSQAHVSHEATKLAATAAPDLVERFSSRATLYRELVRASRNIGGLIGGGGSAAAESQNAAARLRHTSPTAAEESEPLRELAKLFTRADTRIAGTIEQGLSEKLYFVSVNYPRLMDEQIRGVHPTRQRWQPVTSPVQTPLIDLVRDRLQPAPMPAQLSPESRESRAAYEAAVANQVNRQGHAYTR